MKKEISLKILEREIEIDILKDINDKGWSLDYDDASINEVFADYIENYNSQRLVDFQDKNNLELGYEIEFANKDVKVKVWEW